jgi:toxin CptA
MLGVLGAAGLLGCELPFVMSIPLAVLAVACGVTLARREAGRPVHSLVVARGLAKLDGQRIEDLVLVWRGPLAFLRFREEGGRVRRLAWWPDTLDTRMRRELRLAIPVQTAAQQPRSMAS